MKKIFSEGVSIFNIIEMKINKGVKIGIIINAKQISKKFYIKIHYDLNNSLLKLLNCLLKLKLAL